MTLKGAGTSFNYPGMSDWNCHLFGSSPEHPGIVWNPIKGGEPNWFWRWMQFICFGNRWIKEEKAKT